MSLRKIIGAVLGGKGGAKGAAATTAPPASVAGQPPAKGAAQAPGNGAAQPPPEASQASQARKAGEASEGSDARQASAADEPAEVWRVAASQLGKLVSDAGELRKGSEIHDAGGLVHLARHRNRLYAEAKGSGAAPYKVALLFAAAGKLTARCSCMAARSRPFCKHASALLVAWARAPESFVVSETAPADAGAAGGKPRRAAVKKGKLDGAALLGQGVEQAGALVLELALTGVAALGADRAAQLELLGATLRENRLRRLSARTLELGDLLAGSARAGGALDATRYADLLGDMLLAVRKLEKHLGGEPLEERYVEELIGRSWRKSDRRPVAGLRLVEYAFACFATSDNFLIRESRFVDLESGTHFSEKQILPAFLAKRAEPKRSYAGQVLEAASGSTYPGFAPLRLDIESSVPTPLGEAALERIVELGLPDAGAALAAFQEHRRDVFAPDRFPVVVRISRILAGSGRLQALDDHGNALFLPDERALEESLAEALREVELLALAGDIDLQAALPSLRPLAAVVRSQPAVRLELRALAEPRDQAGTQATGRWSDAATAAGASTAAVSLAEVREQLAEALARGLTGLSEREMEPLAARLGELGLAKPAALLLAIVARQEPRDRLDDFVKLYHVLGIALLRLAGATHVDLASLEPVPGYPALAVPRPPEWLSPAAAARRRAEGSMGRWEARLHCARHYESLPHEELATEVIPTWADGTASEFVARALAGKGELAVAAARQVLGRKAGRTAAMTAIRVLAAAGGREAERVLLQTLRSTRETRDPSLALALEQALVDLRLRAGDRAARLRPEVEEKAAQATSLFSTASAAKSRDDRLEGIRRLREIGHPVAIPLLRSIYACDGSHQVRAAAAIALGLLCDSELVERLVDDLGRRAADEGAAKAAAYALGHLGDARGLDALLAACAEGWKPPVIAEALQGFGESALGLLVDFVERQPEVAGRRGAQNVLAEMPAPWASEVLCARVAAIADAPDFSARAALLLRLASQASELRAALARLVVRLGEEKPDRVDKALARTAQHILAPPKKEQAGQVSPD